MADYRSRIHEYCTPELLLELQALINKRSISDNNKKSTMVIELLKKYKVDYSNLGSGTNRVAVLIDGYVFKFALDPLGVRDNDSEFALSPKLYPIVIKTYETNGLISVCEYVELIASYGEFQANRGKIISRIAKIVEQGFLVGDVGFNSKNFCNWGKRTATGELVILDFAYIYKLDPYKMRCQKCDAGVIEYDSNFIDLVCQNCKRTVKFTEMRKMVITEEEEQDFIDDAKRNAVMLEGAVKTIEEKNKVKEVEVVIENKIRSREPRTMRDEYYKNDQSVYSRLDETVFDNDCSGTEETIFDYISDDMIPKEELHRDNNMDAYQQSLEEMRRSRELEVRTDGSKQSGAIRGVMNDNGRVSFITVSNTPQPKSVVNKPMYNVTGKKPQQNFQKPNNQKPQTNNNQKPKFEKPQTLIPETLISKNIIPEKVIIPNLSTGDTKSDILLSLAITFANTFNQCLAVLPEINEPIREVEVQSEIIQEEFNNEFDDGTEVLDDEISELEAEEAKASEFASNYVPNTLPLKCEYLGNDYDACTDEDDYEEEEDSMVQIPAENAELIKAAMSNFESTKNNLLNSSKQTHSFMKPRVYPGDPNTKIN